MDPIVSAVLQMGPIICLVLSREWRNGLLGTTIGGP